jgi:hypothetical protein
LPFHADPPFAIIIPFILAKNNAATYRHAALQTSLLDVVIFRYLKRNARSHKHFFFSVVQHDDRIVIKIL